MKNPMLRNSLIAAGTLGAVYAGLLAWATRKEWKKQTGIDLWVKAELDGLEIERKEKGL